MANLYTLKDHFKESQLYLNRTTAATGMVIVLLTLLVARLVFLQIHEHDLYKTLSRNNQVRVVPITPPRGLIFDRNGLLLAENMPAFSLELTPERTPHIQEAIEALDKIIPLTENEKRQFFKQVKYKRKNESIPIRVKLTEEEVAKFSVEKYHLPGIDIVARLIRHYPLGESMSHVLGYIGPVSEQELTEIDPSNYRGTYYIGKTGIEKFYETELHGTVGYHHIETDAKGRTIRILNRSSPISGSNLHLTLDGDLQKAAFEALQDLKGAIVAIDPNTGDVLALVSRPSFDPNLFAKGIDADSYHALQHSPDRPLFNRALRGQYPPGSTVKPLVALRALELGLITPEFRLFDPGWFQINGSGRLYRDWMYAAKRHGHGWVDLEKAITESCDTYFFTLANRLGVQNFQEIYTQFGLGKTTEIDVTGEASGLVPSRDWKQRVYRSAWYPGDTVNISIGQGFLLATPLQMAQTAVILANKGKRFKPRVVLKRTLTGETRDQSKATEPQALPPIPLKDNKHWNLILEAMQKVVHAPNGTAHRISHGLKYTIAGKTGTSQVFTLKQNEKYQVHNLKAHLRDHSWFIGFAPAENPRIAIAVLIENSHPSRAGKDIARVVFDHFFKTKTTRISTKQTIEIKEPAIGDIDEDAVEEEAPQEPNTENETLTETPLSPTIEENLE